MVETALVQEIDFPAIVGQFLINVRIEDLIVELVQNELDAGSTATSIRFGPDSLICEGDGEPIDEDGWARLRKTLGAGHQVPAKRNGIGTKNHGLRTGFMLGNDIVVQSAGERLVLTLCGDPDRPDTFHPGTWPKEADSGAPARGTRVTIPYRRADLLVPSGEGFTLPSQDGARLAVLFDRALDEAPGRFIGALPAGIRASYVLEFSHWARAGRKLAFRCVPLRGGQLNRRSCRVTDPAGRQTVLLKEVGAIFRLHLPEGDAAEVPRFFRSRGTILGEVAWEIDGRGRPIQTTGKLRYPISFPDGDHAAFSDHGFQVSGPFVSDTARHGLAEAVPRNKIILEQARTAFASVLRRHLLPAYGPNALALIRRPDRPRQSAEEALAAAVIDAGAVVVRTFSNSGVTTSRRGGKRTARHKLACQFGPGRQVSIPALSWRPDDVEPRLFPFASPSDLLLHEATPAFVVAAFRRARSGRFRSFTEMDAIRCLLPRDDEERERRLRDPMSPDGRMRSMHALEILQDSLNVRELRPELVRDLHDRGLVPGSLGREIRWAQAKRSRVTPPEIPGVEPPPIVHRNAASLPLFREGRLKVEPFRLDRYLAGLDWTAAGEQAKADFLKWTSKHHARLKPATLRAIAQYPIWPTARGDRTNLETFCLPPSKVLRRMMTAILPQPASEVLAFPGLHRSGRGAVSIRKTPLREEVERWFRGREASIKEAEAEGTRRHLLRLVRDTEEGLSELRRHPDLQQMVGDVARGHRTLTRAGKLAPIESLHVPTVSVNACRLPRDLIVAGQYESLYLALGAQPKPSASALKRALVEDPRAGEVLYRRLAAYAKATHTLDDLADLPILRMGKRPYRPNKLALRGREFWGNWKQMWPVVALTPERAALLTKAGVAGDLTRELSRGFFEWLQDQPEAVQARHLPQILRHLLDPERGPLQWWSAQRTVGCLPVRRSGGAIELVSYVTATDRHSAVYLPDFPDLHGQLLEHDQSFRLVIPHHPGVDGTLFAPLRQARVKSLRNAIGRPIAVEPSGDVERANATFDALLRTLHSERMAEELPKRLELHHVSSDRLRRAWRVQLARLAGVRIAARLVARYEFGDRQYAVSVHAAVEPDTGVVWLSGSDRMMAFYKALTDHLFNDTSDPRVAYGLRAAVEEPFDPGPAREDVVTGRPTESDAHQAGGDHDGSAKTPKRSHGIPQADTIRAVPAPQPFEVPIGPQHVPRSRNGPSGGEVKPSNASGRPRRSKPATTDPLRNTEEEQEQIRQLKETHYAWHCQACLGAYDVTVAVPPYSYLTLDRHRRDFVEAHHVDHLRNQGVLGARNLLVLCRFHHDALGDRLARGLLVEAIRNGSPGQRRFPIDLDCKALTPLRGTTATVRLDAAPFEIRLFFTREHARAWLDAPSSDPESLAQRVASPGTRRQQRAAGRRAAGDFRKAR